jgi:hypothetical protein
MIHAVLAQEVWMMLQGKNSLVGCLEYKTPWCMSLLDDKVEAEPLIFAPVPSPFLLN